MDNREFFRRALELAEKSFKEGGVPIGAVLVNHKGEIIARAHNENKQTFDPTAHAEVLCMRRAKKLVIKKFFPEPTILYTTLEPCFACGFFVTRTNIGKVEWLLNDPYNGGIRVLAKDDKLKEAFGGLELVAEIDSQLREASRKLMFEYYKKKGQRKIAEYFAN